MIMDTRDQKIIDDDKRMLRYGKLYVFLYCLAILLVLLICYILFKLSYDAGTLHSNGKINDAEYSRMIGENIQFFIKASFIPFIIAIFAYLRIRHLKSIAVYRRDLKLEPENNTPPPASAIPEGSTVKFETIVTKGDMSFMILSILVLLGGWFILLGIGWLLLSHFSYPLAISISMIILGVIVKYSSLLMIRYRALKMTSASLQEVAKSHEAKFRFYVLAFIVSVILVSGVAFACLYKCYERKIPESDLYVAKRLGWEKELLQGQKLINMLKENNKPQGISRNTCRDEMVAFVGSAAPTGGTNDLFAHEGCYLRVINPEGKDLRPHAVYWTVIVRGKVQTVFPENKIIVMEVKAEDWKILETL